MHLLLKTSIVVAIAIRLIIILIVVTTEDTIGTFNDFRTIAAKRKISYRKN